MTERNLTDWEKQIDKEINILLQEVRKNRRWRIFQQWMLGISFLICIIILVFMIPPILTTEDLGSGISIISKSDGLQVILLLIIGIVIFIICIGKIGEYIKKNNITIY